MQLLPHISRASSSLVPQRAPPEATKSTLGGGGGGGGGALDGGELVGGGLVGEGLVGGGAMVGVGGPAPQLLDDEMASLTALDHAPLVSWLTTQKKAPPLQV